MANTKTTVKTTTKKADTASKVVTDNSNEVEELKKQIELLTLLVKNSSGAVTTNADTQTLREDRPIRVYSLTYGILNLLNGIEAQAKTLEHFGDVVIIPCTKLREYLNDNFTYKRMVAGDFYVADEGLINEYGLSELYARLLTKDKYDSINTCSEKEVITMFKAMPEEQRSNICNQIAYEITQGTFKDPYRVKIISEACGVDIDEIVHSMKQSAKNLEMQED